jgi:hypothetical protein
MYWVGDGRSVADGKLLSEKKSRALVELFFSEKVRGPFFLGSGLFSHVEHFFLFPSPLLRV